MYVEVYPLNTQHGRVGNRFDRLAYLGSICLVNTAVLLRRKTYQKARCVEYNCKLPVICGAALWSNSVSAATVVHGLVGKDVSVALATNNGCKYLPHSKMFTRPMRLLELLPLQ